MAVEHRLHTAGNHTGRLPGKGKSSQSRDSYEISCGPGQNGLVLFLLTGASGAGKSSARQAIEADLLPRVECVELRHLGPVPTDPDVAWRQRMAERAVARASLLDAEGRDLLLAGDPVAPGEVLAAPSAPSVDIAVCLLDVDEATQQRRLLSRGDPEELLWRHAAFAEWMRRHAEDPAHVPEALTNDGWPEMDWSRLTRLPWHVTVIDGSALTVTEVGDRVLRWIGDVRTGSAPVFRRSAG